MFEYKLSQPSIR